MEPKAFLNISKELFNLINDSSSGFSKQFTNDEYYPEIVYRTMANRSYYYLYHAVKPVLTNLIKDDEDLLKELKKSGISQKKIEEKIDEIFSHHAKIVRFFEELEDLFERYNLKKLKNKAQYVTMIIKSYKTIREVADYQIDATEGKIKIPISLPTSSSKIEEREIKINFYAPSQAAIDYLTEDIEEAKNDIINLINEIFDEIKEITDFYYVQEIRDIIEKLSRRSHS